jgi:hypothetical protein
MPLEQLNRQLADCWRIFPHILSQKLSGLQDGIALDKSGVTLTGIKASWNFDSSPGFAALSDQKVILSLPDASQKPWEMRLTGFDCEQANSGKAI